MENNKAIFSENKFKWIYLIGFFLILTLPLWNLPPWFSPPDWGKTIVFRIILSLIIFVFLWQILFQRLNDNLSLIIKNILNKQSKVFLAFWLLVALLGVHFLATLLSQNPAFSFWGSPYRSGGFLNFAFYIIFAILAFLILRKSDWQKIWNFSIIIGIFVSIIAIFQHLKILSHIFVTTGSPWSTIGGSSFLAIYLLLLSFLTLAFGLQQKTKKKFFYFSFLLLFLFIILITGARAAYLGLIIGFSYFFFFYPVKYTSAVIPPNGRLLNVLNHHPKKIVWLKALFGILLILGAYGIYCIITTSGKLPQFIQENQLFQELKPRLSISLFLDDPRFSVWKISSKGLIERPILGYGPENFSIAFDKHYDPSLARMSMLAEPIPVTWYDRAHSFLFDIGVSSGILALIIYLLLFAVLFWGLQKIKKKRPEQILICHGLQATFLAYLTANFFSFDIFSTYLISFLLIAYSLHIIYNANSTNKIEYNLNLTRNVLVKLYKYRNIIVPLLFIGLIWFIWAYNIKPFQINKESNVAVYNANRGQCEDAVKRMENILPVHTFLDDYIRANYINIINTYIQREPLKTIRLAPRGIEILKESIEIRPSYTRYWLILGAYYNILLENYQNAYPELVEEWKNQANKCFEQAEQLSPKRQEIFISWAKTYLWIADYKGAEEKAQKCINLNPELGECWWILALINIYSNETEKAQENINIAEQKNYPVHSENSLLELRKVYLSIGDYPAICDINYKLKEINMNNVQYRINLAACYKELGDFEKAKKEAMEISRFYPEYRTSINEFLKEMGFEPLSD